MKLRQLEALRAVVASGTTTQAADLLGLTQSAVSRLITQLESELGLNIFDRRHGRLRITPEGQHFYDVVKKLLSGIDQITAPGLLIESMQDPFRRADRVVRLAERTGSKVAQLPDAGHFWMLDSTGQAAAAINDFWAGL